MTVRGTSVLNPSSAPSQCQQDACADPDVGLTDQSEVKDKVNIRAWMDVGDD